MSRKNESVTLALTPEEKNELERLALELGETWGENPNISKLVRSIALGKYRIVSAESPEAEYIDKLRSAVSQAESAIRKVKRLI